MPTAKSIILPFDVTNCRRHFRRYLAKQLRARQQRMCHVRQAHAPTPSRLAGGDPSQPLNAAEWLRISTGSKPLSATDAMRWLDLSPTPFYLWRQRLDIHPIVKKSRLALYARKDLRRLHAAYLSHTRTEEMPHDG